MRNANQIMHGDHTTCDEYFLQGRPRILMRDRFVVDNLLVSICIVNVALMLHGKPHLSEFPQ